MEITKEIKERIVAAIASDRENYPSDNKHAVALGISASVYNAIKKGAWERQVSDAGWVGIARRLGVELRKEMEWRAAKTPTYNFISAQLQMCQESGVSAILCDIPNIGKTFTAKAYVKGHKNAIYVDCSQVKTKRKMVRKIAKEFGVTSMGSYYDVYEDLVAYMKTLDMPLVVLDEAGDLQYEAFLELKALWNATERCCGWYMMGADGLKAKIDRNVEGMKVGYAEMLSRFGGGFSRVTPEDGKERVKFLRAQAAIVAKVNAPEGSDVMKIVNGSGGGLRRVYTEIEKIRRAGGDALAPDSASTGAESGGSAAKLQGTVAECR